MFSLPEAYVWDFWTAYDGEKHHLFFLYASNALHDPHARHYRAGVGHAVSTDLRNWQRVDDSLVHSDPPAFDEQAIWTGSVTRLDDGSWLMAYTGARLVEGKNVQSLGLATSQDLLHWRRLPGPIAEADPRWYEKLGDGTWHDEAFRDPWLLRLDDGWHLYVTARANHGAPDDRGVIGHVTSQDLQTWQVQPPLSEPGQGFGQLEVMQVLERDGEWFLIFDCLASDLAAEKVATGTTGGVWCARGQGPLGPWDIAGAQQLTDSSLYVGKVVEDSLGNWNFMAFRNEVAGEFVGGITDPMPVHVRDGQLLIDSEDPGVLARA